VKNSSAGLQLQRFFNFLAEKPKLADVVEYLALNASPDLEICGASLSVLNLDGVISTALRFGYKIDFPNLSNLNISSEHPISKAMKTQEIQFVNLVELAKVCDRVPKEFRFSAYQSSCQLPISEHLVVTMAYEFNYESLREYSTYLECICSALKMYLALQSRKFVDEFELSGSLTLRQKLISELLLKGMSNREIASELSYSISLIRQETMRIYAKLDVNGRNGLRNKLNVAIN